jgi:hypothetical protein
MVARREGVEAPPFSGRSLKEVLRLCIELAEKRLGQEAQPDRRMRRVLSLLCCALDELEEAS